MKARKISKIAERALHAALRQIAADLGASEEEQARMCAAIRRDRKGRIVAVDPLPGIMKGLVHDAAALEEAEDWLAICAGRMADPHWCRKIAEEDGCLDEYLADLGER